MSLVTTTDKRILVDKHGVFNSSACACHLVMVAGEDWVGPSAPQFASDPTCPWVHPGKMFRKVCSKALQKW